MPLTDKAVRAAKPKDKPFKLFDERGLYLVIQPSGGQWWRLKYRMLGKEELLALGTYPDISLAEARGKRDVARKLIAQGIDPGEHRKIERTRSAASAADSFEAIALEWLTKFAPTWSEGHSDKIKRRLERDVFPWLGSRPVGAITPSELLTVLRRIEGRGAVETAHRAHQNCGQIFQNAVATGHAERDPSADLRGALPPVKQTHHASIIEPKAIGELLRAIQTPKINGALVEQIAQRQALDARRIDDLINLCVQLLTITRVFAQATDKALLDQELQSAKQVIADLNTRRTTPAAAALLHDNRSSP